MTTKRWVSLLVSIPLLAGMLYACGRSAPPVAGPGPWEEHVLGGRGPFKIAVIDVRGEIVETAADLGPFAGVTAAEDLASQLAQVREDPFVRAVVIRLNTPGGSVVASDQILGELEELRATGKPVVASMGEVAASGGYFIAAGADRIVANRATITGSIGVIMVLLNLEEAAGKLGIEPVIIKSGEHKDIGSPFRGLTEKERRILQSLLDEAYDRFVEVVAEGRGMAEPRVRSIADGRILSGQQAQMLGLVDEIGDFDEAIALAEQLGDAEGAQIVELRRRLSLADLFSTLEGVATPFDELERRLGATGPMLKYLYVP